MLSADPTARVFVSQSIMRNRDPLGTVAVGLSTSGPLAIPTFGSLSPSLPGLPSMTAPLSSPQPTLSSQQPPFLQRLGQRALGWWLTGLLNAFPIWMTIFDSYLDHPSEGDNLAICGPKLIRGAVPSPDTLDKVKAMGATAVIDLRHLSRSKEQAAREAVELRGMRYHNLPMFPHKPPSAKRQAKLLELMRAEERSLVHCTHGKDRTGMACALYEHTFLNLPTAEIQTRMASHGFKETQFPALARWVASLQPVA